MSEERSGTFTIVNELGMHARAATKLVQLASKFRSEIEIEKDGQSANDPDQGTQALGKRLTHEAGGVLCRGQEFTLNIKSLM